jgi:hypothetical protein
LCPFINISLSPYLPAPASPNHLSIQFL